MAINDSEVFLFSCVTLLLLIASCDSWSPGGAARHRTERVERHAALTLECQNGRGVASDWLLFYFYSLLCVLI